jgi:3-oxoacyl-[acyl-carrier-protein] synthase-3
MGAVISTISVHLPERVVTNETLLADQSLSTLTPEKIFTKLGIKQRHIAADGETSLDLAYQACLKALEVTEKESIDFLLFCTQSPDYFLPTSACILQDKLGLNKTTGALDFNLGCSGYIYGLAIAKGLIESQIANKILLVTAETYSKVIHPEDISNRSIFGDAAAATIITRSEQQGILNMELGTDGSGFSNLIVAQGCFRNGFGEISVQTTLDRSNNARSSEKLYMNGPEIFNFTIDAVPGLVKSVLSKNSMKLDDVDYFIFHQANKFILDYLRKKIGIPAEKFYLNMENTGNTVSATIPIGLLDAQDRGIVKKGDKLLLCGFGVGYSWGATIIQL